MFQYAKLALVLIFSIVLQSCNTLHNLSSINLEIIVPGTVKFPQEYKNMAVRYNNSNIAQNIHPSVYYEDNEKFRDTTNLDSFASEIYFQNFINNIKYQQFFDTVIELEPKNYRDIKLNDSLVISRLKMVDPADSGEQININIEVVNFAIMANTLSTDNSGKSKTKFIDPELGLYTKNEIRQIADTTGADLLFSFDYFTSVDGIFSPYFQPDSTDTFSINNYSAIYSKEVVKVFAYWNLYDLEKEKLIYSNRKTDTIQWMEPAFNIKEAKRALPPRRDAVLNAADIAGSRFAEFLVPHWIEVERMYYKSGQVELQKTEELINQNRWMEAAEIWKKNTKNKNKSVAAKSMFNLALACEIAGDMDAAIDWCVKSFYVFGTKNEFHAENCKNYIQILARRKIDIQKIESLSFNNNSD